MFLAYDPLRRWVAVEGTVGLPDPVPERLFKGCECVLALTNPLVPNFGSSARMKLARDGDNARLPWVWCMTALRNTSSSAIPTLAASSAAVSTLDWSATIAWNSGDDSGIVSVRVQHMRAAARRASEPTKH